MIDRRIANPAPIIAIVKKMFPTCVINHRAIGPAISRIAVTIAST